MLRSLLVLPLLSSTLAASPVTTSWFTQLSGQYARLYKDSASESANVPVTFWDHPSGNDQLIPTYAGVSEISTTATDLYIRTSGLGYHIMGPWYGETGNLFPNYPGNIAQSARIPLVPAVQAMPKTQTEGGAIGYFVDGVAMFDSRDAFSYIYASGSDAGPNTVPVRGDRNWNRDAYVNEGVTFDPALAHSAGATYHYHANPAALRYLLGDSVNYQFTTNTYTETPNGKHSPILAWVFDGIPLYGPYGYSSPLDPNSGVRRMISGYQKRDGTNGSTNLATSGRQTLPSWVVRNESHLSNPTRTNPLATNQYGPAVSIQYPIGHYLEDYDYKGDRGLVQGIHFDLNEYNVRWCVTPEFPQGTWAYFSCIAADGTPVFPYNIGRYYFGTKSGANVNNLPANRSIIFEGGPEADQRMDAPVVDAASGDVTLTWSGVEGGTYRIDRSDDLEKWKLLDDSATPNAGSFGGNTDGNRADTEPNQFYRSSLTGIAPFDDAGFDYTAPVHATFTATFTSLPTGITNVTVGGVAATIVGTSGNSLALTFSDTSLPAGNHSATVYHPGGSSNSTNTYTVASPRNILVLIVDDWGIDSSPIDNKGAPGTSFPAMPNLEALAARGIRFTNAYSQPVCSPTRACILTGRYGFRTGVGHPSGSGNLPASELTLPEIFSARGSAYQLASFGKWHLGGGVTGPATLGGWPEFRGILAGGVNNYYNWTKTINGSNSTSTTYTTTDQVNDAVGFINSHAASPWFVWMGFNAPHDPFHNPPANLHHYPSHPVDANNEIIAPANRRSAYEAALEALDTEIGRLLDSVDLEETNIILIGDNGTPGQVVQAPFTNGHAKDSLYDGGVHVPLVIAGPDVPLCGTSTRFVHCVDLFSTILELARIDVASATSSVGVIDSKSLLPILKGQDVATRCIVSERFGTTTGGDTGRTIRDAGHPGYKLIAVGDPTSAADVTSYQLYDLLADPNEQSPLTLPPSLGDPHYAAYQALVAKDLGLGPASAAVTLYLEIDSDLLANMAGAGSVPANTSLPPDSITIDGRTATFVSRVNSSGVVDRYWVKCTLPSSSPPYTTAIIDFSDNVTPNGTVHPRVFTAIRIHSP